MRNRYSAGSSVFAAAAFFAVVFFAAGFLAAVFFAGAFLAAALDAAASSLCLTTGFLQWISCESRGRKGGSVVLAPDRFRRCRRPMKKAPTRTSGPC